MDSFCNKRFLLAFSLLFASSVLAKDPTRPIMPGSNKASVSQVKKASSKQPLTAIFTKNKRRVAMIEGKLYKAGDFYRGNKILNIYQDKVLLNSSSGNFQLTLIPKIKK